MEQSMVPQVNVAEPMSNPDAAAKALTGNTMTDIQNIAKEMGVTLDASGNVVAQPEKPIVTSPVARQESQPVTQAAQTPEEAKVEVPAKFQNPDGTVNVEKLEKSTVNVEQMIAKYQAKEKEAQTLQNRVNNPPPSPVAAQPVVSQPVNLPLSPLEIQVANDLIREYAAVGVSLPEAQAVAQARVQVRLQEARYQAEVNATQELRQRVENSERARELQGLLEQDPWLASEEAVETLWKIRQENPWLNNAPQPFTAAYTFFKGRTGHGSQVSTPTPKGTTAKAPPTPVGPVTRVQKTVDLENPKSLSDADLLGAIKGMYPGFRNR